MTSKMSQTLFLLYRPEPARPMSKARSVGAHSICARGGLSCRKRARADMESAPTFLKRQPPRRGGQERAVPRAEFSPFVENGIRRGAFYMRPRRLILPQAGTGGYGIRPYVFETAEPQPSRGVTAGGGYDFRWSVYRVLPWGQALPWGQGRGFPVRC